MEELLDLIAQEESPSQVSDKIKEILFTKAAERVDSFRPTVANSMFGFESSNSNEEE